MVEDIPDEIIAVNHQELKDKYKGVDIDKIIDKKLQYYKLKPFKEKTKLIWIDKIKEYLQLVNLDFKPDEEQEDISLKKENPFEVFNIEQQAEQFNKITPLFYDKAGLFWLWNDTNKCWEMVDEIDILNMIKEATNKDIVSSKSRTEIINVLKQQGRLNIPKPIKPTWVQFKNIIYDVNTRESFEATPKYFVTNPIPWRIKEDYNQLTPVMDKIFEEWVGKENVQTLYEILAYSLIPDYPINRLFCYIGSGLNGKSKFQELHKIFVGEYNCCTTELDTLLVSRFEITRLYKKLVCFMGETNFNEMSKTSILKRLTGGDLIGFEYKNKDLIHALNYAKIIIGTNNLPVTSDKTLGFYRRWLIIDFPNRFTEQKDILAEIPEEEYNNLATKCLIILGDLLKNRSFTNEGSIEERMERFEARSNFLCKFLELYVEESPNDQITSADFYKKFNSWCKENHHREMSEISLGMAMKKLGYESGRVYFNWLFDGKGGQVRCWLNIKWK